MRGVPAETAGLTEGYEALRAVVLGHPDTPGLTSPRGLAIFLRKGMVGWMGACQDATASVPTKVPHALSSTSTRAVWSDSAELAAVLAGMALAAAGGALSLPKGR
ncbi:MAG: hypothetical protein HY684_03800 [Chloroflexi bacterium]|nr:hypothetical protein [Chloroflexota bacterium]